MSIRDIISMAKVCAASKDCDDSCAAWDDDADGCFAAHLPTCDYAELAKELALMEDVVEAATGECFDVQRFHTTEMCEAAAALTAYRKEHDE